MLKKKHHTIDFIFPLALFLVFAASALLVVLLAANTYGSITTQSNDNYTSRTSLSYIREKIRHYDADGNIDVGTLDGEDCLVIRQSYGDANYLTYIYQDDGFLKELFIKEGIKFNRTNGTEIMPIEYFGIEQKSDKLFCFSVIDAYDNDYSILINMKSSSIESEGSGYEQTTN